MDDAPLAARLPEPPPRPERAAVGLIETMRADGGRVALLDLHLARLSAAARRWQRPLDADALRAEIRAALRDVAGAARVRVVLGADGAAVAVAPLDASRFETAAVFPEPLAEAGTWRCRYKTTARAHYDRAVGWAAYVGVDEPILLNARGEVMEGARTSVWLREGDAWITPPLASGGLGGVARAVWLAEPGARDSVVTPERLAVADAVWLCNAVRGCMRVRLVIPAERGRA